MRGVKALDGPFVLEEVTEPFRESEKGHVTHLRFHTLSIGPTVQKENGLTFKPTYLKSDSAWWNHDRRC